MTRTLEDGMSPWTGSIPNGWRTARLKRVARLINERTELTDRPYLGLENVESGTGCWLPSKGDVETEGFANLFERHDVLFGKLRPYLAKVYMADGPGRCTGEMLVLRPHEVLPEFLRFVLLADETIKLVDSSTYGVKMPRAEWEFVGRLVVPVPKKDRQRAIAAFLDRKTAAIDDLIAKKERQIELLQSKRQALITQAVTKGLDPSVPMKRSGIEWLGEIPDHWPVVRVSYIATVQNGMTPSRDRIEYWEGGTIPWISSSQVNDYVITSAREFITDRAIRETSIRMVPSGSVLVGLVGQGKTRGLSARMAISGCINQNVAAITPGASMDGRFLHLVLRHAYPSIRELGRGGQQDAMNCEIIRSLRVPMPPLSEQLRLIDQVDGQHAELDAVIARVETHVGLLREYRQALISAAVTGKIEIPAGEAA
jgi:type I restriction enzyme S subunit